METRLFTSALVNYLLGRPSPAKGVGTELGQAAYPSPRQQPWERAYHLPFGLYNQDLHIVLGLLEY